LGVAQRGTPALSAAIPVAVSEPRTHGSRKNTVCRVSGDTSVVADYATNPSVSGDRTHQPSLRLCLWHPTPLRVLRDFAV